MSRFSAKLGNTSALEALSSQKTKNCFVHLKATGTILCSLQLCVYKHIVGGVLRRAGRLAFPPNLAFTPDKQPYVPEVLNVF